MNNKFWTVSLDDTPRPLLTEHMDEVRPALEGGYGRKVWGARVEDAAAEHGDTSALALTHRVGQLGHNGLDLLQHFRLLRTDG